MSTFCHREWNTSHRSLLLSRWLGGRSFGVLDFCFLNGFSTAYPILN